MEKKQSRIRRGRRTRAKIRELEVYRLSIHRTPRHIYAQVISPDGSSVLASASTLDKTVKGELSNGAGGNIKAASVVGKVVAERAKSAGIESVAFDRSGFRYHGRVKALADAAREAGLQF
ncbi:MAG: 50S ribosomal protein L18 [Candidatus Thiodiazotropha sp.]|jgi:large subunit ribosomal protein L18